MASMLFSERISRTRHAKCIDASCCFGCKLVLPLFLALLCFSVRIASASPSEELKEGLVKLKVGSELEGVLSRVGAPQSVQGSADGNYISSWEEHLSGIFRRLYLKGEPSSARALIEGSESAFFCSGTEANLGSGSEMFLTGGDGEPIAVSIGIIDDSNPNSYALPADSESGEPARIFLTRGLLEQIQSVDELAFVLAHESAHIRLNHFVPPLPLAILSAADLEHISAVRQGWEFEADRLALYDLKLAGMNASAASAALLRLERFESVEVASNSRNHPQLRRRLIALSNAEVNLSKS